MSPATLWLVPLALAAFAVALVLVYLRLRWWARRYAEMENLLAAYEEREHQLATASEERALVIAKAELEIFLLWSGVRVATPRQGVAAATLRALFPTLEVAGARPAVTCSKCRDAKCVGPGHCDDPGYFFGGDAR